MEFTTNIGKITKTDENRFDLDLGSVTRGVKVKITSDFDIEQVKASCGCTTASIDGRTAEVSYNREAGEISQVVTFVTKNYEKEIKVYLLGRVI